MDALSQFGGPSALSPINFENPDLTGLSGDNDDYGRIIAQFLDWGQIESNLSETDSLTLPDWNEGRSDDTNVISGQTDQSSEFQQTDQLQVDDGVPAAPAAPLFRESESVPPPASTPVDVVRQVQLLEQIENVDAEIRDLDDQPRELLALQLQKAQLRLEYYSLPGPLGSPLRTRNLVSLELEEVSLQIEILRLDQTPEDLEEDEKYAELKLRRIRLKKERDGLKQIPKVPLPVSPGSTDSQVRGETPPSKRTIDTVNRPETLDSRPPELILSDALKVVGVKPLDHEGTAVVTTLQPTSGEKSHKRKKLTDQEIKNRIDVKIAGGQCLNCRSNRSKPACQGESVCDQCQKDGLECIRPTLKDKNVFSARE